MQGLKSNDLAIQMYVASMTTLLLWDTIGYCHGTLLGEYSNDGVCDVAVGEIEIEEAGAPPGNAVYCPILEEVCV